MRVANAILQQGTGITGGKNAPMVDLQTGGQLGFAPDLASWVSNQAYTRRNVFCLLVEAPKGFNYMQDPATMIGILRSLVELHPLSIDGLNAGLEVEFGASSPVGGSGQVQEDFTDVKEVVSKPVFRWSEKYGMPIATFFRKWITDLMMDPNSKVANIATLATKPTDMLSDMTSATMIFIEPDPTFTKVVKSWLCTNMMPSGTGEITGKRDLTQANEPVTYDITFTAITQFGTGVDAFAQQLLSAISLTGANPQNRPAFINAINADILATKASFANNIAGQAAASLKV